MVTSWETKFCLFGLEKGGFIGMCVFEGQFGWNARNAWYVK